MFDIVGGWLGRRAKSPLKTVAIVTVKLQRTDWRGNVTKYDGFYILKMNSNGVRVVEVAASIDEGTGFNQFMRGQKHYLIHLVPWIEGTIDLPELIEALSKENQNLIKVQMVGVTI